MRKTTIRMGLAASLLLGAIPAGAGTPQAPEVTDPAGDANAINAQGNTSIGEGGPDTRPASIDGADLVAIWYRTSYYTLKYTQPNGSLRIQHVPTTFNVNFKTTGPISPTFGPSLVFRVPTSIGGCETWFEGWIRGPNALPNDLDRGDFRKITAACPGGAATVTAGFTYSLTGNVLTLSFPFDAAGFSGPLAGFIKVGTTIAPPPVFTNQSGYPHVRAAFQSPVAGAFPVVIDETVRPPAFVVGADVPPDVDCGVTPENPECPAPPAP